MVKKIVMYSRSSGCPYVTIATRVLHEHQLEYRELFIDKDPVARERVLNWTGFLSVPTLVIAEAGSDLPYEDPTTLEAGRSPRGVDRGAMITEASSSELEAWLRKHGFIGGNN